MEKLIKAIIVDDEQLAIDTLEWQIENFCTHIEIVKSFTNPEEATDFINSNSINLCFLDIDMPEMTGFEFLTQWDQPHFDVIFTTAYSEFALKAFRVSAFDYLLKPIDEEDLALTLEKYANQKPSVINDQLELLVNQFKNPEKYMSRIALPTTEGVFIVDIDRIIRLEAYNNYTTIHIVDSKPIVISKTLKDAEKSLDPNRFFRIHQSHSIDIQKVDFYQRGRGGNVTLINGDILPVSKYKKEALLKLLGI